MTGSTRWGGTGVGSGGEGGVGVSGAAAGVDRAAVAAGGAVDGCGCAGSVVAAVATSSLNSRVTSVAPIDTLSPADTCTLRTFPACELGIGTVALSVSISQTG